MIREVTEPTSPDPYYPDKKRLSGKSKQDFGADGNLKTGQDYESPSKHDLIEPSQMSKGSMTDSQPILNLE